MATEHTPFSRSLRAPSYHSTSHYVRYFEPSPQSALHPSITLLVHYRSHAMYLRYRRTHVDIETVIPNRPTRGSHLITIGTMVGNCAHNHYLLAHSLPTGRLPCFAVRFQDHSSDLGSPIYRQMPIEYGFPSECVVKP